MTAEILDGKQLSLQIKRKLHKKVKLLKSQHNVAPGLAVLRVGNHPASQIYVSNKCRQSEDIGIVSSEHVLPHDIHREAVLDKIYRLNEDPAVHGILIQLPLPEHLDSNEILSAVDPQKDVDGLHPLNMGLLAVGRKAIQPCTPKGCLTLLKKHTPKLAGKRAVMLGCSNLVGKPMGLLLLEEKCTVSLLHKQTKNIEEECRQGDILVVAAGYPKLVKKSWVKPGAIVIDVGINRLVDASGKSDLVGDVDFDEVREIAGAITPVPGGVGPMTVVSLLENTVEVALAQIGRSRG